MVLLLIFSLGQGNILKRILIGLMVLSDSQPLLGKKGMLFDIDIEFKRINMSKIFVDCTSFEYGEDDFILEEGSKTASTCRMAEIRLSSRFGFWKHFGRRKRSGFRRNTYVYEQTQRGLWIKFVVLGSIFNPFVIFNFCTKF